MVVAGPHQHLRKKGPSAAEDAERGAQRDEAKRGRHARHAGFQRSCPGHKHKVVDRRRIACSEGQGGEEH
eukprot:6758457-Lingulodinium_polyedra.AAC.1